MSQTSSSETPVTKLARFIVDKRKAFFLVFLAAVLFCGSSIDKVVVNNDITSYLPAETETRRGLTLMDEEFTTYASAQVMLSNVTYRQAEKVAAQLAELDGVSSVAFDDSTDHFKDSSALFSVSFTGEEGSPEADAALAAVKELAAPYDHYVFPSGDPYEPYAGDDGHSGHCRRRHRSGTPVHLQELSGGPGLSHCVCGLRHPQHGHQLSL